MLHYLILWSRNQTQSYPDCQSPQFQTSLLRSGPGTEQRLSCIHRTPETKLSNKIPYNYTTVKPQLGALAKHFLCMAILAFSYMRSSLQTYFPAQKGIHSLCHLKVSSVNAKWLLPFVMCGLFWQHLMWGWKSPDILKIIGDLNSLKLIFPLVSNCFVDLWRLIFAS